MQVKFNRGVSLPGFVEPQRNTFAAGEVVDVSEIPNNYLPGLLAAKHCEIVPEIELPFEEIKP